MAATRQPFASFSQCIFEAGTSHCEWTEDWCGNAMCPEMTLPFVKEPSDAQRLYGQCFISNWQCVADPRPTECDASFPPIAHGQADHSCGDIVPIQIAPEVNLTSWGHEAARPTSSKSSVPPRKEHPGPAMSSRLKRGSVKSIFGPQGGKRRRDFGRGSFGRRRAQTQGGFNSTS